MVTARRPRGSLRRSAPSRQAASATLPPGPGGDKPWYVDNWSFGEPPSSEAAELESLNQKKTLIHFAVVVTVVIIAVTVLAIIFIL